MIVIKDANQQHVPSEWSNTPNMMDQTNRHKWQFGVGIKTSYHPLPSIMRTKEVLRGDPITQIHVDLGNEWNSSRDIFDRTEPSLFRAFLQQ